MEDIKLAKAYDMSASFSEVYKNQIVIMIIFLEFV
jgi:hypothetical protein